MAASVAFVLASVTVVAGIRDAVHTEFSRAYQDADVIVEISAERTGDPADEVSGGGRLSDETAARLAGMPSAATSVFTRDVRISVGRPGMPLASSLAHPVPENASAQYQELASGRWPQSAAEVVTAGTEIPIGEELRLYRSGAAEPVAATVVGTTGLLGASAFAPELIVYAMPDEVDQWSGGGDVGEFLVAAAPGVSPTQLADDAREALADLAVGEITTVDERIAESTETYFDGKDRYLRLLTGFLMVAVVVAVLVVSSAFGVILGQRTRELTLLRSLGASKTQSIITVITESAAVALLGGVLGMIGGIAAARGARAVLPWLGLDINLDPALPGGITIGAVLLGAGALTSVAVAPAVLGALQRTTLGSIHQARRRGRSALWRILVLGSGCVTLWLAVPRFNSEADAGHLMRALVWSVGIFLGVVALAAVLLPVLAGLIARGLYRVGLVYASIGGTYTAADPRRAGGVVAIVLMAVTLLSGLHAGQTVVMAELPARAEQRAALDVSIAARDGKIPKDTVDRVAALSGIERLGRLSPVAVTDADGASRVYARVIDPVTYREVTRGSRQFASPDAVIVPESLPITRGVGDGERTRLIIDGVEHDVVVSRIQSPVMLVSADLVRPAEDARISDMWMRLAGVPGSAEHAAALQEVRAAVAEADDSVVIASAERTRSALRAYTERMLAFAWLLISVSALISVIGLVNIVGLATLERKRDARVLGAVGMTKWGYLRTSVWEHFYTAAPAAMGGAALGLVLGGHLAAALLRTETAAPTDWTGALLLALAAIGLTVMAATWPILRTRWHQWK